MPYNPTGVSVSSAASYDVLYVADAQGRIIQGIHLTESDDGGGPLSHAGGEEWATAQHGLISMARRSDAGGPPAGVADGQLGPLSLDGSGNLRVLATGAFVQGQQAHDAALTANPVAAGAYAALAQPAAVSADGDLTRLWADPTGRLVTVDEHPTRVAGTGTQGPVTVNVTTTGNSTVIAAPTAGLSIHVTSLTVVGHGTAKVRLGFKGGDSGTIRGRGTATEGGGFRLDYRPAWQLNDATALIVTADVVGDVDITAMFYVAA